MRTEVHIAMIALGSTGDVRPYVLLGRKLSARGHGVTVASFEPMITGAVWTLSTV